MGKKTVTCANGGGMKSGPRWITVISMLISFVALIFSGIALYEVNIKPADISIFPAERIGFAYDTENSFMQVAVPITFTNNGAQTGMIQSLALVISDPNNTDTDRLFLKWSKFAEFNDDFVLEQSDRAIPISLSRSTSQLKYVLFDGGPDFAGWTPQSQKYDFHVLAWTGEYLQPDVISQFSISFSDTDVQTLEAIVQNRRGILIWKDREEWGCWRSKILSTAEYEQLHLDE